MILSGEGKIPDHMFGSSTWCSICYPELEDADGPFDDGPEDIITDLATAFAEVKTIIIEEGITEIGHKAFDFKYSNKYRLQTVVLPQSLEKIGAYAFNFNINLQNINFPESLKEIEGGAFRRTGLTNVYIPDSVETLGEGVFDDCEKLKSIVFTNAVCSIASPSLEKITYPLDYEEVPQVESCANLKKIITPTTTSVKRIKPLSVPYREIFYCCKNLELVTLSEKAFKKFESKDIEYEFISEKLPSKLDKVTNLKCTDKGSFTISWSKVENAGFYQVYHYEKNKWVKIYEGSKTSFTLSQTVETGFNNVIMKPTYADREGFYGENKFKVRACAYDGNEYLRGAFTTVKTYRVGRTYVTKTTTSKNKATLAWEMIESTKSNITGYQVFYRVQGASSYKKFGNINGTKCTVNKLTSGKTYQFKVRAYYKLDGKIYYGDYSPIITCKIK